MSMTIEMSLINLSFHFSEDGFSEPIVYKHILYIWLMHGAVCGWVLLNIKCD